MRVIGGVKYRWEMASGLSLGSRYLFVCIPVYPSALVRVLILTANVRWTHLVSRCIYSHPAADVYLHSINGILLMSLLLLLPTNP